MGELARFLELERIPTGQIRGIRDPCLLDVYETVADDLMADSYRTIEVIAERKAVSGRVAP